MIPNARSLALSLAIAAASIQKEYCSGFTSPHCHSISPPSISISISIPTTSRLCAAKSDNKEDALKDGRLHMVPKAREIMTQVQIEQHQTAAATALEKDAAAGGQSVAEVWEMLLEDCNDDESCASDATADLVTLSDLILGDSSSMACYATRAVLTEGVESFCFKEIGNTNFDLVGGPIYEPRQMDVVATMRSRAKVEAMEAARWEDLKQRLYNASSSDSAASLFIVENEAEEIQTALKSLERLGCMANLSPDEMKEQEKAILENTNDADELATAKQFLQNIDRRATPEVARQLLVSLGIWTKHTNLDIVRLKVRTAFDAYLEDAAVDIASHPPPDLDEGSRLDLTHLPAFAIDEASTKEIDDALSVEMLDTDGSIHKRQRLWIHIADPTRYIELGSPLGKGSTKSDSGGGESNAIEDMETTVECLRQLQYASEQRLLWRIDGGSLESISPYELPDLTIKARPSPDGIDGWEVDIYAKERRAANRIVTELMLAANEAVALYGDAHGVPMPFRSQRMDALSDDEIEMTPEGPCRSWIAILSTSASQISSTPLPHAGLGLDMYAQVTSPVRRYADLALHFQVKSHLRGDPLPFPGNDSNGDANSAGETMVGIAKNAGTISRQMERPANDYWLKEFLRRRGTQTTKVLVLHSDRWKDDVYKLFLPELGAICTYRSTKSLAAGERREMQSVQFV
ncbi:RNB-domain-containing protein [Fragilariopsis cylindrus CCMP1102]|uniref:RNB-domain-containing protein n=1 Tax=Fragilariopsis cylindrus CCMP1102 TaxID=635003 RepID=A0A1E7FMS0_9STRA|nr:RNB-domain-containing protein [Fragilariopsis cylindrus CCMP1102]|eukprot:OEU19375.1 RNB-domain-containing protein [Fragilariopsis cylindrus CCMP1102]